MTYIISYLRERADGGEDLTYADFVYVSTGRSLVAGIAGVMGGILANKIGLRPTLSLGAALYRHGRIFRYPKHVKHMASLEFAMMK